MKDGKSDPIGIRSMTLWGAGFVLMGNGVLTAMALVFEPNALTEMAQALAGQVGPSVQIGIGWGMLGIRRRL